MNRYTVYGAGAWTTPRATKRCGVLFKLLFPVPFRGNFSFLNVLSVSSISRLHVLAALQFAATFLVELVGISVGSLLQQ